MPLFGGESYRKHKSAAQHWRDLSALTSPAVAGVEATISAAQKELPSRDAYWVLAAAYLVAAQLAGLDAVPSDEACRFAGLSAAVLKRASVEVEMLPEISQRYQVVRGRLRGSVYIPRDVEEAFAGHTERLEGLALEPSGFETVRRLFRQIRRPAVLGDDTMRFMLGVAANLGAG
jgi:hypothetical protein